MNYENAPATELLDTDCLCCGRPLVDAASVTAGVGPICRKKYGYSEIPESVRVAANLLIHEAAAADAKRTRVAEIAVALRAMGAEVLSEKILDRFLKDAVTITRREITFGRDRWEETLSAYVVKTIWCPDFNETLKELVDWRDRTIAKRDGKFDGWAIKPKARIELWAAIREHFAGQGINTPNGRSMVPGGES